MYPVTLYSVLGHNHNGPDNPSEKFPHRSRVLGSLIRGVTSQCLVHYSSLIHQTPWFTKSTCHILFSGSLLPPWYIRHSGSLLIVATSLDVVHSCNMRHPVTWFTLNSCYILLNGSLTYTATSIEVVSKLNSIWPCTEESRGIPRPFQTSTD